MPVFDFCFLFDQKCQSCVSKSMALHYDCFVAIVKVLSTAEVVLEYEAGVSSGLQSSLAGCSYNLGVYISLVNGWCLALFL